MPPWSEFLAPLAAFAAGLPAVTLALLLWLRTRDRSFELLATGLGLLATLVFLLSVGIFLMAARLVENPDLRFVLWNTTFLLSYASLLVLRRFAALVIPGQQGGWRFPRLFTALSALFYLLLLALAFAFEPPLLDFRGRTAYLLSASWYLAGFAGPTLRLWKARATVPAWVARLFGRGPLFFGLPLALLAIYEILRWASPAAADWPSLGPLAAVFFFALVTVELFRLSVGQARPAMEGSGLASPEGELASRIAARCLAEPLTRRELEILALLLEGWRNGDIATRLGLSPNTVRNHVYGIYQKTGASNRMELRALAD